MTSMTDRDIPEVPVSELTVKHLVTAIDELRSFEGFLMDMRPLYVENVPGVEAVCVGESERGLFAIVSNESETEGPFLRDVFIIEDGEPKLYRIQIDLDDEELAVVRQFQESVMLWQHLLIKLDEGEQAEQKARFYGDSQSFSETLHAYKDIGELKDLGEITEDEAESRYKKISLAYTLYESDDPDVVAYETRYAAAARALMDYQAVTLGIDKKLDIVTGDILEDSEGDSASLVVPLSEARVWTLIGILDRATASNAA